MTSELTGEILRGVVALAVIGGYIYLAITGGSIPAGFDTILAAVVGFYFGAGSMVAGARLARGH